MKPVKVRVTIDIEYPDTHGLNPTQVRDAVESMLSNVSDGGISLGDDLEPDYDVSCLTVKLLK